MKFASKLTATVIILSTVTVPALGVTVFYFTRNIIQENITADQLRQTQSILNDIDRTLYKAFQDIELISKDSQLELLISSADRSGKLTGEPGGHEQYSAELNNKFRLTGPWDLLNVVNIQGDIVYSSRGNNVGKNIRPYPADSAAHYAAVAGRRYYSDVIEAELTTRPTMIFSSPIRGRNNRAIVGTVAGYFSWPTILQILDRTHSSRRIQLFNRDGVIIGTPSKQKSNILKMNLSKHKLVRHLFGGMRISSGIEMLDDRSGSVLATAISQTGYLGYRGNGWGLLLGVPTQTAFVSVFQLARNITIIVIVMMTIIVATVYVFAKRIAKPVEVLKNAAVALGEGDYNYPINIKSGDEIQELSDSFIQMARKRETAERELREVQAEQIAQERLATLGQLTAIVSHELRNPLATISISSTTLRGKLLSADGLPALDRLERSVERCDRIIDELLDYTRLQARTVESIEMNTFLDEYLSELPPLEGIVMQRETSDAEMKLNVDKDLLLRALVNIVDNACQALHEIDGEKRLKIASNVEGSWCCVTVSDNGPGIPAEILDKIFNPMFSTKVFGVGLGMTIVQRIMEQLGGRVDLDTVVDQGTVVSLWLPLAEDNVQVRA
jgi:signal transduction histidine kinase